MSTYKIGEILVSQRETEVETIFGRKEIIPKGNKIIITAHRLGHHIRNGMKQPLQKDDVVKGYDNCINHVFDCNSVCNYLQSEPLFLNT